MKSSHSFNKHYIDMSLSQLVHQFGKPYKYYTIFLILALQGHHYEAKRILDIYATLFAYSVPEKIDAFQLINCSLTSSIEMRRSEYSASKSHPAINFKAIFAHNIADIKLQINISIKRGKRYDTYLSAELDLCELVFSKVQHPFVEYFRDELVRVIKPQIICPLKKGILYEVDNFMLTTKFVPIWAPTLNWKADLKWSFHGKHSFTLVAMGIVETIFK